MESVVVVSVKVVSVNVVSAKSVAPAAPCVAWRCQNDKECHC
jgi:hypothetical protein